MSTLVRLNTDYKKAMLIKDSVKTGIFRMVRAALQNEEIAKGPEQQLTEDEVVTVLKRMIKSRRDSVELYLKGGAEDRAAVEQAEIDLLQDYLPKQMTDEEIDHAVLELIIQLKVTNIKQMGLVLKGMKEKYGTSYDGAKASAVVKARLS